MYRLTLPTQTLTFTSWRLLISWLAEMGPVEGKWEKVE